MATEEVNPALLPQPGVTYPLKVDYCPNCSMPFEVRSVLISTNLTFKNPLTNPTSYLVEAGF